MSIRYSLRHPIKTCHRRIRLFMELTQKLGRYEPIVAEFDKFIVSARQPLPRVIWANPLKRDIESIGSDIGKMSSKANTAKLDGKWLASTI